MSKTIRFEDVLSYIKVAPEEAVRQVYQEAAKRLNLNTGDSDEEGPKGMTDMSEMMSNVMDGPVTSRTNSIAEQLRAKVESNSSSFASVEATVVSRVT